MALIEACAFNTGLLTAATLTTTEFDAVSVGASAVLSSVATFLHGLNSYSLNASTGASSVVSYGERDWGADKATVYVSFYVRFTAVPAAVTSIFSLYDSASAAILDIRLNASGNWSVYNYGDATTYTGTGNVILAARWYRVELKLLTHAANGTIDLKIDGTLEPGASGLTGKNTKPGGDNRKYRIGVTVAQANAGARQFSDVLIDDASWMGIAFIKTMRCTGSPTDNWTTVDGGKSSHQTQIDLPWASATTDLIRSSTASQEQQFSYPNVILTSCTVLGVIPILRHRRGVAGNAAPVTINIRSSGVDGTTAVVGAAGTTFTTFRGALQATDPNTGVAWTVAGLNAMTLKIVKSADANQADINASLLYVALSVPVGTLATIAIKYDRFDPIKKYTDIYLRGRHRLKSN